MSNVFSRLSEVVKSKWFVLVFFLPLPLYIVYKIYELEATKSIVPFFRPDPDKSFGFYEDFLRLCFYEFLWLTFFLFISWYLFVHAPVQRWVHQAEQHILRKSRVYVPIIIGVSFVTSIFVAGNTLQQFANSADEYVYLYQAETLSEGKLWQKGHPLVEFFNFNHIGQKNEISVGRFPPGWPLVLTIAYAVDFPLFLVNPILGLLALIVFYRFARMLYDERIAIWSLLSLAITGYYIFNSASYFSHTSCLLYALGFMYGIYSYERKPSALAGLLAGISIGLLIISRYYTAALMVLPVGICLLYRHKLKAIPLFLWISLGALPFLVFLFWYNNRITGNGFLPVTVWTNSEEGLGFVLGHSFAKGIEHIVRRSFMFLYWCSPALFVLYFIFLVGKVRSKTGRFIYPEDYFFFLLIIGYFFYHHIGGNQYGPRFFLEALPFLILFVLRTIFQRSGKLALSILLAGLIYAIIKMPFIISRENQVVSERLDLYKLAHRQNISNAVILISSSTGIIRPMPTTDLTRNGMDFNSSVIYALDIPEKNQMLMRYYPDRSFYKYVRDPDKVEGQLVKVR